MGPADVKQIDNALIDAVAGVGIVHGAEFRQHGEAFVVVLPCASLYHAGEVLAVVVKNIG